MYLNQLYDTLTKMTIKKQLGYCMMDINNDKTFCESACWYVIFVMQVSFGEVQPVTNFQNIVLNVVSNQVNNGSYDIIQNGNA